SAFFHALQTGDVATEFKKASATASLAGWTHALTDTVVVACERLGLAASAKWHKLELLPIHRSEYLSLDVVAFAEGEKRWRFPSAVMELENSARQDQIAYSLWKVISVRADLRVVFCYRKNRDDIPELVRHLREEVIEAMGLAGRIKLDGKIVLVIGTRSESET